MQQSMIFRGNCLGSAPTESFFNTFKLELAQ